MTLYLHPKLENQAYADFVRRCHASAATTPDGMLMWLADGIRTGGQVALIPVERVPGHGRLVIAVVFDFLDAATKARIDAIYRERRPFAVGYFRLWQQNRLHMRRYQALESALDCTEIGVILIDRAARIIFANSSAEDILAADDGLGRVNGRLRATHLRDGVNLQAALSHVARQGSAGTDGSAHAPMLAFRRKNGPALVATFVGTRTPAVEQGDVAATIYVVDPKVDTVKTLTPLCRLYGLSPVETRLVCHLAAGDNIAAVAEKLHIREQTARSYLKQIFIKTNTNRQTELVVLMLSSLLRMNDTVLQEALTDGAAEKALARFM